MSVVGRFRGVTLKVSVNADSEHGLYRVVQVQLGTEMKRLAAVRSCPAGKHVICLPETEPNTK